MSLLHRLRAVFGARAHAALDGLEDPVATLEYAYQKQLDVLADVRRGVADVLTSEKRLEIEANQYTNAEARAKEVASVAIAGGDEVSARRALERVAAGVAERERLEREIDDVRAQRQALETTAAELERRLQTMRTHKIAVAARYAAAKAAARAGAAVTGLDPEMDEVGRMVERAREQSLQVQARAQALAQLAADTNGAPERAEAARASWVDEQLSALRPTQTERLRGELNP